MEHTEQLMFGNYYPIYNRGIDSCKLFKNGENYEYFPGLYDQPISPIASLFAWVLMPNHFHFLVRIKDENEIKTVVPDLDLKPPHQYFSNFFNAYTKAINKRYLRHGFLFERPFKMESHR